MIDIQHQHRDQTAVARLPVQLRLQAAFQHAPVG